MEKVVLQESSDNLYLALGININRVLDLFNGMLDICKSLEIPKDGKITMDGSEFIRDVSNICENVNEVSFMCFMAGCFNMQSVMMGGRISDTVERYIKNIEGDIAKNN